MNKYKKNLRSQAVTLKYSKSTSFYSSTQSDFFSDNDKLLQEALSQNLLYASQPKRDFCW